MVISGNIHLSSDLRRLAFVRLLVWLTSPRTRMSRDALIGKYRESIIEHREQYDWNMEPNTKKRIGGVGMGSSKRAPGRDVIASNHLTLSQDLMFLRKGESRWAKNGYVLASLSIDQDGSPSFYDQDELEKELQKEGFIATLRKGEKLVFSTALMSLDIDRTLPLILMFEDQVTASFVKYEYLGFVYKWLARKSELEPNSLKRGRIRLEQRDINEKISRLNLERKQSESLSRARKRKPSVRLYCHEQTSPRLHFLRDLGYVEKENGKYRLSDSGVLLKKVLIDPFFKGSETKENDLLPLENETILMDTIVNLRAKHLPTLDFERFDALFLKITRLYARSGAILLDYYNIFKACTSHAHVLSTSLPLELFEDYMSELSRLKKVTVSTSGRGTKYIKVHRKLILP